MQQQEV